jgi:signal peptidase I
MNKSIFSVNLVILGLFGLVQLTYIFIPMSGVGFYQRLIPAIYAVILAAYITITGRDRFPAPIGNKASDSLFAALLIALTFLAAVILAGMTAGMFLNRAVVHSVQAFMNNVWVFAVPAILLEAARVWIIRSCHGINVKIEEKIAIIVVMTVIFTIAQVNSLIGVLYSDSAIHTAFSRYLPALVMNGTLIYMAFTATLKVLVIVRCLFLFKHLSPVIPNISEAVWASIVCGVLFISVIIYHYVTQPEDSKSRTFARLRPYKQSLSTLSLLVGVVAFIMAFMLRAFVYFPTVVLTGSMSDEIDRGSVAIVQKIPQDEVEETVKVDDILLMRVGEVEVMHRVIEIIRDSSGTRYITKGDANPVADSEPVEVEQVIGIVNSYIPYIGYPVVIIRSFFN